MDSIKELIEYEDLSNKSPLLNRWASSLSCESNVSLTEGDRTRKNKGLDKSKLVIDTNAFDNEGENQIRTH